MPRRVTAIQSYWPLTTLTKPFSAVCALPKLPRRFARATRTPPLHALDTQALARPSGAGRPEEEDRERKEWGLASRSERDVRLIPERKGRKKPRGTEEGVS